MRLALGSKGGRGGGDDSSIQRPWAPSATLSQSSISQRQWRLTGRQIKGQNHGTGAQRHPRPGISPPQVRRKGFWEAGGCPSRRAAVSSLPPTDPAPVSMGQRLRRAGRSHLLRGPSTPDEEELLKSRKRFGFLSSLMPLTLPPSRVLMTGQGSSPPPAGAPSLFTLRTARGVGGWLEARSLPCALLCGGPFKLELLPVVFCLFQRLFLFVCFVCFQGRLKVFIRQDANVIPKVHIYRSLQ